MKFLSTYYIVVIIFSAAIFTVLNSFEETEKIDYGRKIEIYRNNGGNTELIPGTITIFLKFTMKACIKACKLRQLCSFVNFHFITNVCSLIRGTELGESYSIVDSDGYGLGVKSSWDLTHYLTCNVCSDKEICRVDTGECAIEECRQDREKISFSYKNGNNFNVGMKIVYYCEMHYEMVVYTTAASTCLSDGSWTATNFTCIEVNECENGPCQNGGQCIDMLGSYTCSCASGWTGTDCEIEINECDSSPCLNGGQCSDMVNGYSCSCLLGFEGSNCETDINECESNPCASGSSCVDEVNGYTCSCAPGYTGNQCQHEINECDSGPCLNGGQCSDMMNGYSCSCLSGFDGLNCETDINECDSCPCVNGGHCTDNVNGYSCSCSSGFAGINCETDINECESNPCRSESTCVDEVNGYTCNCPPGYAGNRCQNEIDECNSDPCKNGGTCGDLVDGYTCTCPSGFTGDTCQTVITCPDGWSYFANSCYRLEADRAVYSDAKQFCLNLGGHLADVTSQAEMDFLQQIYLGSYSPYAIDGVWVSTNDIGQEDVWVLSDGQIATYLNWHSGQPDGKIPTDDCVIIWPNLGFEWNDLYCDYSYWFFCEQEI